MLLSKRAVYVGGLADGVTTTVLRAAMIPFGDIKNVDIVSKEKECVSYSLVIHFVLPISAFDALTGLDHLAFGLLLSFI